MIKSHVDGCLEGGLTGYLKNGRMNVSVDRLLIR